MKVYVLKYKDKYVRRVYQESEDTLWVFLTSIIEFAEMCDTDKDNIHLFPNIEIYDDDGEEVDTDRTQLKYVEVDIVVKEIEEDIENV